MIFELVYKTVIVMIDINDALRKLNVLSSKKNKNNIDKLIDLIEIDQKTNKSFNSETAFESLVLSAILTQITFKKSLNLLSKLLRSCILITHEQSSLMKYRESSMSYCIDNQLLCLLMPQSILNKYRFKLFKSIFSIQKTATIVLSLNIR